MKKIQINEPKITQKDIATVVSTLKDNSVSTYGNEKQLLEEYFSDDANLISCLAVNSGSQALNTALCVAKKVIFSNQKIKVATSDFTFVATVNAIKSSGLDYDLLPCNFDFCDIDFDALTVMHKNYELFVISLPLGDLTPITKEVLEFLNTKKRYFIIDAAASILLDFTQILKMKYCLGITLSFNGNKVITAGGGGIIMSAYPRMIEHARNYSNQYRIGPYVHEDYGFNVGLPAINCSLALSQINRIDEIRQEKFNIYSKYQYKFAWLNKRDYGWRFREIPNAPENASFWIFSLTQTRINPVLEENAILGILEKHGLPSSKFWRNMHEQPFQQHDKSPRNFFKKPRVIALPSSNLPTNFFKDEMKNFMKELKREFSNV